MNPLSKFIIQLIVKPVKSYCHLWLDYFKPSRENNFWNITKFE